MANDQTRACIECDIERPVGDFYLLRGKPEKRCKPCRRIESRERHRLPAVKARALITGTAYQDSPAGRAAQGRYRVKLVGGLARMAREAVDNAVRRGALTRGPCEGVRCRSTEQTEGHHDDYRRQLVVRWLCPMHHRALHQARRLIEQELQRQHDYPDRADTGPRGRLMRRLLTIEDVNRIGQDRQWPDASRPKVSTT